MIEISNDSLKEVLGENFSFDIEEAIETGVKEYEELFGFTANLPREQRTSEWVRAFGRKVARVALQTPQSR